MKRLNLFFRNLRELFHNISTSFFIGSSVGNDAELVDTRSTEGVPGIASALSSWFEGWMMMMCVEPFSSLPGFIW